MEKYYHIPAQKSYFSVQENCCYLRVVYEGEIGFGSKIDKPEDEFNSENLICHTCDPKLTILPVPKAEFDNVFEMVKIKMKVAS